jgi:hypothetical protein
LGSGILKAQTPADAIMMKKGEICIAAVYENSWFDHYWEGTYLRTNGTIATVKQDLVNPMLAIGLTDWLNFLASCPYVSTRSTEPNGGKFEGASGFQDLGLALKAEFLNKTLGTGNLTAFGVVGYSTPITNYLSDYRPYSIGFGADQLTVRGILQYQLENGLYFRGALAYLQRGSTEAERDYYYNNGSFYTAWMDVPSAWNYHVVAGKWMLENSLKLELNYQGLNSTSGDDVRAYNAAQPTNKVDFGQAGFSAQYYFKKLKGLGVLVYANQVLTGRNIGKTTALGGGFTYQFKVF